MEAFKTLLFPDTKPRQVDLAGLLPLCDRLFFYALPGAAIPSGADQIESRWSGYVPAVLAAEELDRFQSMIRDLLGHEREYYRGQLASLSAHSVDRDENSVRALIAGIRTGKAAPASRQEEQEGIWQALLLLKLAEMLREEEGAIAQGMAAIAAQESALFAGLKGDEEADEEELDLVAGLPGSELPPGPTVAAERLVKAWGRLYLRDPLAGTFPLLATSQPEILSLFAEIYQSRTGRSPQLLLSLSLPAMGREETEATDGETREKLQGAARCGACERDHLP